MYTNFIATNTAVLFKRATEVKRIHRAHIIYITVITTAKYTAKLSPTTTTMLPIRWSVIKFH